MWYWRLLLLGWLNVAMAGEVWLVVANGPPLGQADFHRVWHGEPILALDGAANYLASYGIKPDVILGDFDSVEDPAQFGIRATLHEMDQAASPYYAPNGTLIVPAWDQDRTDLEKGIRFLDEKGAEAIIIINALGGRLDHTLSNLGLLRRYDRPDRPMVIRSAMEWVEYVKDRRTCIRGPVGAPCAIMGYPEGYMTTSGLLYNGEHYRLSMGFQESVCNTLAAKSAEVTIEGEALVHHPVTEYGFWLWYWRGDGYRLGDDVHAQE